ncbi:hypothetical protein FC09_GL001739 [Lactobacillus delbrueckii subsp. indicus DSM 15996]|nr:hypothetical protein FC09_GL001739 [Lactobacillus delbrueckii subsp. indicus DSM 15996]
MSYQDGKYQTEAEGLHGPVKVATTITDGKISAVEVLVGAGEYQSKANEVIADEIIASQSHIRRDRFIQCYHDCCKEGPEGSQRGRRQ